ncbi:MAG: hypothetical protein IT379_09240 [Deltaproteobacteria bacterium]|nr:hypothetical protein [Deltaproteobacteria bacterium]
MGIPTQASVACTTLLLVVVPLLAGCGYTLEGAGDEPSLVVRLHVPAVASTEPDATGVLRASLRRELVAHGVAVDRGARSRLVVEVVRIASDDDLVAVSGDVVLAGRTRVDAEGLARLEGAGQAWSVRAIGRADAPAPSARHFRAVRARLVHLALRDLARAIAQRLVDGGLGGR